VQGGTPTPEPASAILFIVGLSVVGYALRKPLNWPLQ
jgi:hypothetical protein